MLIAVSLSATIHTDPNGNFRSVIQKPLPSFTQVSQEKVWHQGDLSDAPAKNDYRMEYNEGFDQNQEAPPGMEMWKFTNKYVPNNTHGKISKFSRNTSP